MKIFIGTLLTLACAVVLISLTGSAGGKESVGDKEMNGSTVRLYSVEKGGYVEVPYDHRSEEEWKKALTPQQFRILRKEGTERAFTGKYWKEHRQGIYRCAGCSTDLFSSETKYESGTGWPSFWEPIAPENIREVEDNTLFVRRTEVECARCGGHLGHVFNDGPKPTGLRYCLNSASLTFVEGLPGKAGDAKGVMK